MITTIKIAKCTSYPDSVQPMEPLLGCNYVFGFNGTGKSTIARLIKDPTHPDFACCHVEWKDNNPLDVLLYNRDFIKENFDDTDDLKGVFTLGAGAKDAKVKIAEKKTEEKRLVADIALLETTLAKSKVDLTQNEESTEKACWDAVNPRKSVFRGAFAGGALSGTRAFMTEALKHRNSAAEERPLSYLQDRAAVVFDSSPEALPLLPALSTTTLVEYEAEPLLQTKIIASGDVPIARLVKQMNNSDWIRQGRGFLEKSEGKCPYCQQVLPPNLEQQMATIFNAEFTRLSAEYAAFVGRYERATQDLSEASAIILSAENPHLEASAFQGRVSALESLVAGNLIVLGEKQRELSRAIQLATLKDIMTEMQALITAANEKTAEYNRTVADLDNQKAILTREIWKRLVDVELKPVLDKYRADKKAKIEEIRATEESIKEATDRRDEFARDIKLLQAEVTDVHKVLNDINRLLKSFGFTGFWLEATADDKGYRIIRADGKPARESLSEGERSFVTLLYFFYLVSGSHESDAATSDRVVVFDDPVSSMDSEVLFIVSTLVREVCDKVNDPKSHIKQVFCLTHNVYFHKEVSFKRTKKARDTFWVVRKPDELTEVKGFKTENPVKSSYQLLWDEIGLKEPSPATVQNSIRRILEYYFQFHGSTDIKNIAREFEDDDPDKKVCLSMISWLHDGSHSIADDVTYSLIDQDAVTKYLRVFRRVFEATKNTNHYEMMCSGHMREQYEAAKADVDDATAPTLAGV